MERLFTRASRDRIRDNGFKLKEDGFRLGIRIKFFVMGLVRNRNRLPREVVDVPIRGSVQGQVGRGFKQPGLLESGHAHSREVGLDDL